MKRRFNPGATDPDRVLEDDFETMEQMEHEESIYVKRIRLSGDERPDDKIIQELHDLERRIGDYIMQHQKNSGEAKELLDSQDVALVDFAKKEIPSLAAYIEKRSKDPSSASPKRIYDDWKNGKDFLKK